MVCQPRPQRLSFSSGLTCQFGRRPVSETPHERHTSRSGSWRCPSFLSQDGFLGPEVAFATPGPILAQSLVSVARIIEVDLPRGRLGLDQGAEPPETCVRLFSTWVCRGEAQGRHVERGLCGGTLDSPVEAREAPECVHLGHNTVDLRLRHTGRQRPVCAVPLSDNVVMGLQVVANEGEARRGGREKVVVTLEAGPFGKVICELERPRAIGRVPVPGINQGQECGGDGKREPTRSR